MNIPSLTFYCHTQYNFIVIEGSSRSRSHLLNWTDESFARGVAQTSHRALIRTMMNEEGGSVIVRLMFEEIPDPCPVYTWLHSIPLVVDGGNLIVTCPVTNPPSFECSLANGNYDLVIGQYDLRNSGDLQFQRMDILMKPVNVLSSSARILRSNGLLQERPPS